MHDDSAFKQNDRVCNLFVGYMIIVLSDNRWRTSTVCILLLVYITIILSDKVKENISVYRNDRGCNVILS